MEREVLRPAVRSSVVGEELHSGSRGQKDASSHSPREQNFTVKETNHVADARSWSQRKNAEGNRENVGKRG